LKEEEMKQLEMKPIHANKLRHLRDKQSAAAAEAAIEVNTHVSATHCNTL